MPGKKKEEKEKCSYKQVFPEYQCNREALPDDEHCIFHSKDIEGKKDKFNDAFWKEFDRQEKDEKEYDFTVFVFSGDILFKDIEFKKAAHFGYAQFSGVANFGHALFSGEAYFVSAEFHSKSFFTGVEFEDFNKCDMINTSFYNVFGLLEYIAKNRNRFKHLKGIKYLHDKCKPVLGEATVSRLPLLSREIKDDLYLLSFKEKHPIMHFIWWLFADCGRSFKRWALWSLGIALLFAVIFTPPRDLLPDFLGVDWLVPDWWINLCNDIGPYFEQTAKNYQGKPLGFWSSLYFSIVTFTTLGFGDVITANWMARLLVAIEVILGYIMLGGLISILANKLARRS